MAACGEPAVDARACDPALSLSCSMVESMVVLGGCANAENLMALGLKQEEEFALGETTGNRAHDGRPRSHRLMVKNLISTTLLGRPSDTDSVRVPEGEIHSKGGLVSRRIGVEHLLSGVVVSIMVRVGLWPEDE